MEFDDIREINSRHELKQHFAIGLWRSGGFYGTYGLFWSKPYGKFHGRDSNVCNATISANPGCYRLDREYCRL